MLLKVSCQTAILRLQKFIIDWLRINTYFQIMVQLPGDFFLVGLNRRADFICLQWLKISLLLFSSAKSCLYMIYNFSFVQSWQVPVTVENGLPLSWLVIGPIVNYAVVWRKPIYWNVTSDMVQTRDYTELRQQGAEIYRTWIRASNYTPPLLLSSCVCWVLFPFSVVRFRRILFRMQFPGFQESSNVIHAAVQ